MLHLFLIIVTLTLFVVVFLFVWKKLRKPHSQDYVCSGATTVSNTSKNNPKKLSLIAEKLDLKLKTEKMYTNPDLSIQDLASEIGTNRSYISSTINTYYNQNFCSYINQYRFQELADTIIKENSCSHKELATKCGFGSIDSMKRTVKINTGLSLKEWKDYIRGEDSSGFSEN